MSVYFKFLPLLTIYQNKKVYMGKIYIIKHFEIIFSGRLTLKTENVRQTPVDSCSKFVIYILFENFGTLPIYTP